MTIQEISPPHSTLTRSAPIDLAATKGGFVVAAGNIQIFLAERKVADGNKTLFGERRFLFELSEGDVAFCGIPDDLETFSLTGDQVTLLAVGSHDTVIRWFDFEDWLIAAKTELGQTRLVASIDKWLTQLSIPAAALMPRPAVFDKFIAAEDLFHAEVGAVFSVEQTPLWLDCDDGRILYLEQSPLIGGQFTPIIPGSWASSSLEISCSVQTTTRLIESGELPNALYAFHGNLLNVFPELFRLLAADEVNRTREMRRIEVATRSAAFDDLANAVMASGSAKDYELKEISSDDPLEACVELLCKHLRIEYISPKVEAGHRVALSDIQAVNRLRFRKVRLGKGWHKGDSGQLLHIDNDSQQPIVLLRYRHGYVAIDPVSKTRKKLTHAQADSLNGMTYMPYPGLEDEALKVGSFIRRVFTYRLMDLAVVLILGVIGGLIGMGVPLAVGFIVDEVIPAGDLPMLGQVAAILALASVAGMFCRYGTQIASLRMEGWAGSRLQAGIIDRVLRLPVSTLRTIPSGELMSRALVIQNLEELFTSTLINSLMNGIYALFSIVLLFAYSLPLAIVATVFCILVVSINTGIGIYQRRFDREQLDLDGKLTGQLFQTVVGIEKLRLSGSEVKRFSDWARLYADLETVKQSLARWDNTSNLILSAATLTGMTLIFGTVHVLGITSETMSIGAVAAFLAAYSNVLNGLVALAGVVVQLLAVRPMAEHAKPILEAKPERSDPNQRREKLTGSISFEQVSFQYPGSDQQVLDGLTFSIRPGQSVGVVGSSGSGKSTLVRLLLGFDAPNKGYVRLNGHDMRGLDIAYTRDQIGVVLQESKLLAGTLLDNITGGNDLISEDEVMRTAKAVALDKDIKNLPMGLHTLISDKAAFSGGQLQRIAIARALIAKPRIILFDEATSALDNISQKTVTQTLNRMGITRISIAHRLSTIRDCDLILVLDQGKVVEQGDYDSLMKENGLFSQLAARQGA